MTIKHIFNQNSHRCNAKKIRYLKFFFAFVQTYYNTIQILVQKSPLYTISIILYCYIFMTNKHIFLQKKEHTFLYIP